MPEKKDATPAGVSDEDKNLKPEETEKKPEDKNTEDEMTTAELEAIERQKNPLNRRQEMIDQVSLHRNEELAKELGTSTLPSEEEEEDEVLKDDKPKPDKKKAPEKKEKPPEPTDEEDELIIDGAKQKVTKSKIYDTGKRALQKELAADKKLEEAGRRAQEIVTAAQQEAENIRTGKTRPSEGDKPSDADERTATLDDPDFDKKLSGWVSKIQYGSEDEGKQALKEILMQGRGSTATPVKEDDVIDKVERRLFLKGIRQRFDADFKDLMEDPELFEITRSRVNKALQSGEPNTWETYEAVGQAVREKFVRHETVVDEPEKKPGDKPINLEQRREKKRSLDSLKTASARTTEQEAPVTNPDVSATIAQIRKSRHQG